VGRGGVTAGRVTTRHTQRRQQQQLTSVMLPLLLAAQHLLSLAGTRDAGAQLTHAPLLTRPQDFSPHTHPLSSPGPSAPPPPSHSAPSPPPTRPHLCCPG
jgi:hypothetical protein